MKDTDKVVKTYPMAIPDKQKTIIQREARESGYNFETGGKYLSRLYDKKTWNYGKYITEPLDNFPVKGIVVKLSGGADSSIVDVRARAFTRWRAGTAGHGPGRKTSKNESCREMRCLQARLPSFPLNMFQFSIRIGDPRKIIRLYRAIR